MRSRLTGRRGFRSSEGLTLLEVIIALAILGTGIIAVIQLYSASLRTTAQAEEYSKAIILARSFFDEAYAAPWIPEDTSADLPGGLRVERKSSVVEASEGLVLYEITVRASTTGGKTFEITGRRTLREKQ